MKEACEGLKAQLTELYRVDEVGNGDVNGVGKVEKGTGSRGCYLIRLTPAGVEEIMEVRVAVVGNVDAGKSTTLGVLTRGGLDDGRGKVRSSLLLQVATQADQPYRPEWHCFAILTRLKLDERAL